jgi:hypothetical protein
VICPSNASFEMMGGGSVLRVSLATVRRFIANRPAISRSDIDWRNGVHYPYGQSHGEDPQVVADREEGAERPGMG